MNGLHLKLLKKQRELDKTGFTIPFLIGASRNPIGEIYKDEPRDYSEFVDLLNGSLVLNNGQECIGIAECTILYEPVVAIYESGLSAEEFGLNMMIQPNGAASSLYVSSGYCPKGDYEFLIDNLWKSSKTALDEGRFSSSENSGFSCFSAQDINFIEQLI